MKVIKKKCKRAYPDHYLLLVNARHGKGELDFDRVIEEMKTIHSPFLEVWVVVMVAPGYMKVVRVAPGALPIDLDLSAELPKAIKQAPFVKRGIRGTGAEIRDLGPTYVPIPRGD